MAEIRIPPVLRAEAGGNRTVSVEGGTVRTALGALLEQYPALTARVLPDGDLPAFLNVFVDGQDVRLLDGLDTAVADGTAILLLPAVAGGALAFGAGRC
jgi:molybdopterin synthase sulfur carrier subunit